jgi:porphobilinogen synthase
MSFPAVRLRRNRKTGWSRKLVAENHLSIGDLILPIILIEGENKREPITTMPGVARLSIDLAVEAAVEAAEYGIPALALFPAIGPDLKSEDGAEALKVDNLLGRAVTRIKRDVPNIGLIADVALDPYTSHGHDGLLVDGEIVNDATVEILCRQAIAEAEAGIDIVAPSDMMDGRIGAIRRALDQAGYSQVQILSYAVKYASIFYGPFRDALSTRGLLKGDKRTYQMDVANGDEALREIPACPISTSSAGSKPVSARRPSPIRSAANTRCCASPPPPARSTTRTR